MKIKIEVSPEELALMDDITPEELKNGIADQLDGGISDADGGIIYLTGIYIEMVVCETAAPTPGG